MLRSGKMSVVSTVVGRKCRACLWSWSFTAILYQADNRITSTIKIPTDIHTLGVRLRLPPGRLCGVIAAAFSGICAQAPASMHMLMWGELTGVCGCRYAHQTHPLLTLCCCYCCSLLTSMPLAS
jgi:hypothetical protein